MIFCASTLSNKSLIVRSNKVFCTSSKSTHSTRMCFTVSVHWQVWVVSVCILCDNVRWCGDFQFPPSVSAFGWLYGVCVYFVSCSPREWTVWILLLRWVEEHVSRRWDDTRHVHHRSSRNITGRVAVRGSELFGFCYTCDELKSVYWTVSIMLYI